MNLNLQNAAKTIGNTALKAQNMEGNDSFNLRKIPTSEIELNRNNFYDVSDIEELAQDIKEYDLHHNIVVVQVSKNKYRLISGERRLKACKILGWETIPSKVLLNVNEIDERIMIINANRQARVLNTQEKIKQTEEIEQLLKARAEIDNKKVNGRKDGADIAGISVRQFDRNRKLKKLIPEILELVDAGLMGESGIIHFADMPKDIQLEVYKTIKDKGEKITRDEAKGIKNQFEKRITELEGNLKKVEEENRKLLSDNKTLESQMDEMENEINTLIAEKSKFKREVLEKNSKIEEINGFLADEQKKNNPDKKLLEKLKQDIQGLETEKGFLADKQKELEGIIEDKENKQKDLLTEQQESFKNALPSVEYNIELGLIIGQLEQMLDMAIQKINVIKSNDEMEINDINEEKLNTFIERVYAALQN